MHIVFNGTTTSWLSQQKTMKVRKQCSGIVREVKEMNCKPIILYPTEMTVKNKGKINFQVSRNWENLSPADS